jgi:selenocysteine lyase/cysteine desulfurase
VEARAAVASAVNARVQYGDAATSDAVLFVGAGATAAANKLAHVLGLTAPLPPSSSAAPRPLVLVGPHEHHSNLLPWRESCADVIQLPEAPHGRGMCLAALRAALEAHAPSAPLMLGAFAAASNVTGVVEDVDAVTRILHAHGALAVWDYAAAACGGPALDMNPVSAMSGGGDTSKDAMFLSPHKLAGGPGAPGLLVVKRALLRNAVPQAPGGGTVFFVTEGTHRYVSNREEREEGGTPDVLGAMRAAAALRAKVAAERAAAAAGSDADSAAVQAPEGAPRLAPARGVAARASALAARLHASLAANAAITVLGPPMAAGEHRLPVISFLIRAPIGDAADTSSSSSSASSASVVGRWLHPNFVCAALNDVFGLQTRGGCDCAAPYGLRLLGIGEGDAARIERELEEKASTAAEALRPGWTRLSLPWFASEAEAGYALAAVHAIAVRASYESVHECASQNDRFSDVWCVCCVCAGAWVAAASAVPLQPAQRRVEARLAPHALPGAQVARHAALACRRRRCGCGC